MSELTLLPCRALVVGNVRAGMLAANQLQLATHRESLANVETVWAQREPSGTRVVFTA